MYDISRMVKLVKSEADLPECCVTAVEASSSTSSLQTDDERSRMQQMIGVSPTSNDSGIVIDELATVVDVINHNPVEKSLGDEELPLLTTTQPNTTVSDSPRSHLESASGSFLSGSFSTSLSSMGRPLCRICHLVHDTPRNPMVAPCRCCGTVRYVHIGCLVHWLEISSKRMCPRPRCELCGYQYKRHPCIDLKHLRRPHIDAKDVVLNMAFMFAFIVMVICAACCIHFLRVNDNYQSLSFYRTSSTVMSKEDVIVIACSFLFFIAFFIAVLTQYRAEASIFRIFFRFWLTNRNWRIRNYDLADDPEIIVENLARREKIDAATNTERCVMLL